MTHPIEQHQTRLTQILGLLRKGALFSLAPEQCQTLETEAGQLIQKLGTMEARYLTIGLIGGTGVGKSTLMNSLAGAPIASTSHRRPHTDRVLIYRHESADAPPLPDPVDVPRKEILHQGDAIRQILLCDLPDFDSLAGEHRERVIRFMEHLDLLLWVTSPEKYADRKFYEFMDQVPKAGENFTFVLNKVDLLFEEDSFEKGYEQLNQVVTGFSGLLKGKRLKEPILFALSSKEAFEQKSLSPWNQFPAFRQHVFRERNAKQISAIKALNLDVEIQTLTSVFEKEIQHLERASKILSDALADLETDRKEWLQTGREIIDRWFGNRVQKEISLYRGDSAHLVGPGHGMAMISRSFEKRAFERAGHLAGISVLAPPKPVTEGFHNRFEWMANRLRRKFTHENMPARLKDLLEENLDISRRFESLGESFFKTTAAYAEKKRRSSLPGFRMAQWFVYIMVAAAFLFSVGGETAWRQLFEMPSLKGVLNLLVAIMDTLFSTRGLAALGSCLIINSAIGLFFYRRYRKILLKETQKSMARLKDALSAIWEKSLESLTSDLRRFRDDMESRSQKLCTLQNDQNRAPED